jgi:hypothetical protein
MYIPKQRLLITNVACWAEPTIPQVVRLSAVLLQEYDFELLIIDKSSQNETCELKQPDHSRLECESAHSVAFEMIAPRRLSFAHPGQLNIYSLRLIEQSGIMVLERKGVPAPFPISLGNGLLGKRLVRLNSLAARFSPGLFAFWIVMRARPLPAVASLLAETQETSAVKARRLHAMAA